MNENEFPWSDKPAYASWNFSAENGVQEPELWQVYLLNVKGVQGKTSTRSQVSRGWKQVALYDLPLGDEFREYVVVNHFGWAQPYFVNVSSDTFATEPTTGTRCR